MVFSRDCGKVLYFHFSDMYDVSHLMFSPGLANNLFAATCLFWTLEVCSKVICTIELSACGRCPDLECVSTSPRSSKMRSTSAYETSLRRPLFGGKTGVHVSVKNNVSCPGYPSIVPALVCAVLAGRYNRNVIENAP